jgi:PAT family beta-lactamase induction signal transducer AmpG
MVNKIFIMNIIQLVKQFFSLYTQPKMVALLCLGFASGLPLALTASTLTAWLAESGVDKTSIGLFASVATPYALKFLWAPLVDGLQLPFFSRLGRRRGWLIATQLALIISILGLGMANPAINPWLTGLAAFIVAFFSATQDIVADAYRVELLPVEEQGAGAASFVLGYRFGMIASTAGALYLATYTSWSVTYFIMGALLIIGIATVLITGEPQANRKLKEDAQKKSVNEWLSANVIAPFADFMQRSQWLSILLFILLYKLADAFMGGMTNPFLLEIGFEKTQIASVVKVYGLIATIVGSFVGGAMIVRLGILRTLWICGIAHALTNLMFVIQARVGADLHILALGITMENLSGGMGTAAFVAYLSSLTHLRFTATQYALLSSFAAFGRTWLSTPAGWFAETLGWEAFFLFATSLAIPGLVVLAYLQSQDSPRLRAWVRFFGIALIACSMLGGLLYVMLHAGFSASGAR